MTTTAVTRRGAAEQPSEATHHVLWLLGVFNEDRTRVGEHVREGKGETTSIQARMEKGNTDTGNLSMMSAEVNAMKDEIVVPRVHDRQPS